MGRHLTHGSEALVPLPTLDKLHGELQPGAVADADRADAVARRFRTEGSHRQTGRAPERWAAEYSGRSEISLRTAPLRYSRCSDL